MTSRRAAAAILLMTVLIAGCRKEHKVGSKELLDIKKEQQQAERLGAVLRSPDPTTPAESPGALGAPQQSPTSAQAQQQAERRVQLVLIKDPPYYQVDAQEGQHIQVAGGSTVRVTNNDDKVRRFRAVGSPYDTGDLQPGQSKEFVANIKGKFQVEDPNVPFATGTFEVS